MPFKEKLVKRLEEIAGDFLDKQKQEGLIAAMRRKDTGWVVWKSQIQGVLKNLSQIDYLKFRAILLFLEQRADASSISQTESFLIERIEFYKDYDFKKEEKKEAEKEKKNIIFIEKFFRILVSRAFLGILVLGMVIGFIFWFYFDREAVIEFSNKILKLFLRVVD